MITWLLLAIALYYVQVFLPASFKYLAVGREDYLGAREQEVELSGPPARLDRALANMKENFPPFAALAVATLALGVGDNAQSILGAQIFVVARLAYVPLYAMAVPFVRSLAAVVGWVGMIIMALPLLTLA